MEFSAHADVIQSFQHAAINLLCFITVGLTPELQYRGIPLKGQMRHGRRLLTSLAMVVMKAGGLAVAMRERACRAERAESAAGLRGSPIVMLNRDQKKKEKEKKH